MDTEYIEVLGIYPGMYASKFRVKQDVIKHYLDNYLNSKDLARCFIAARDSDEDDLFVDMNKLLAFYVLDKKSKDKSDDAC